MASCLRLTNVLRNDSARWYRVSVNNGFEGTYPYVWLRDNCRCTQCYHPSSWQRASLMADLDPDVTPSSEELIDEGRVLRIIWPDQHRSDFAAEWLNRQRKFSDSDRDVVSSPDLQTWGAELNGNIPTFEFEELLQDDMELYNWLSVLNTKGLAVVKGAPTDKGACRNLAEKVAYLKKNFFGEEFQVFSKSDASDLAYTPKALGLHVDMVYIYYMPGIQMLHCIERTNVEGGENQFVDGLQVAEQIKKEFPESYKLLTTREIDSRHATTDDSHSFHVQTRVPTIHLNQRGEFQRINFSNSTRAPYMSIPVGEVTEMYRALKLLYDVMYRPGNLVHHQLAPGEIVTFNNGRVLHARSAYTITGAGSRHLEGAYLDWDETHSRMRILREKLFGDRRL